MYVKWIGGSGYIVCGADPHYLVTITILKVPTGIYSLSSNYLCRLIIYIYVDYLAVGPGNLILNVQPRWENIALQSEALDMIYVV